MPEAEPRRKPLFWVDLEMTGLDENAHRIIEVAVIITDVEFKVLEEYHRVVFQPPEVLAAMDDWCKKTHGASGLTAAIPQGTPLAEVEKDLVAIVERHYRKDERVVLTGNSVGNDKRFLDKYLPDLAKRLHYRLIDVSSFKEIFRDRYGFEFRKKSGNHRALDDIRESIEELKGYLAHVKIDPAAAPAARGGSAGTAGSAGGGVPHGDDGADMAPGEAT